MKNLLKTVVILIVFFTQALNAQNKTVVADFSKVVISPHIETTFVKGEENSVTILDNTLTDDKVNIEVKGNTLRVYLDDAKEVTKAKKIKKDGMKMKVPIYDGKVLTIKVVYKNIDELSLRGEQRTFCESLINAEDFRLKIYGESQITFNEVNFNELDTDIYGESQLTIKKGTVNHQKFTAFGEGKITTVNVKSKTAKLKAYGEAVFKVNASESIKFTAYGEAELYYKGNPEINRGLSIGETTIIQI